MWRELLDRLRCAMNCKCSINGLDIELTEDDIMDFVVYAIEGKTELTDNPRIIKSNIML